MLRQHTQPVFSGKKTILSILLICLIVFITTAGFAGQISVKEAQNVANNWYLERCKDDKTSDFTISEVYTESRNTEAVFYIFNFVPSGYVMVAADDNSIPILGYSRSGSYETENHPPAFDELLNCYADQIEYARENDIAPFQKATESWNRLNLNPKEFIPQAASKDDEVEPLLTTTWDQGRYYNEMCPYDVRSFFKTGNNHVPAGCGATAMAQVMKYWGHPLIGQGSKGYEDPVNIDYSTNPPEVIPNSNYGWQEANFGGTTYGWANMPNNVTSSNTYVQTLLYHCGVSTEMNYGPYSSTSNFTDTRDALVSYFRYDSSARLLCKSNYSNYEWENMIRNELDNGRPLIYSGRGTGGHGFILDGYKDTNHFHFNWGWSGLYDDYFYLTNLNPGIHIYTNDQAGIFYLEPFTSTVTGTITLSGGSGNLNGCRVIFRKMEDLNYNEYTLTDKYYTTTNELGEYEINLQGEFRYKVYFEHLSGDYENETKERFISSGTTNINTVTLQYNPDKYIIVPNDYSSIQEGLDHIQNGGTVVVINGTYRGEDNCNLTWSDKHITLRAQSLNNPENCIIEGNGYDDEHAFYLVDSQINNNDQIIGFTIRDFDGKRYFNGAVCFKNSASPLIKNCIIENCELDNYYGTDHYGLGIAIYCEGNTIVDNCIIRNNVGFDVEGGAAIACKGNVVIKNNEIYGNRIQTYLGGGTLDRQGLAIYIIADENNSPTIHNNEMYNNIENTSGALEGALIYTEFDDSWNNNYDPVEITNNTIYNNESNDLMYLTDNAKISICGNLIYENTCNGSNSAIHILHISSYSSSNSYTINNNTIVDNDFVDLSIPHGAAIQLMNSGYYYGIYNNIIAFNQGYGIRWNTGTEQLVVGYSNLFQNSSGNYDSPPTQETCCIHIDPIFTDRNTDDYTLKWNASGFSPCIDTGHPGVQYENTDGTPADMGALPTVSHDYFKDDYDNEEFDHIDWISFPVLNNITTGWTNALNVLERQYLIDDDPYYYDDILDYVLYEDDEAVWYYDVWQTNLTDGEFDSKQGYIFVLQDGYDDIPVQGISGTWLPENTPIQLYANKENWVGCFLKNPIHILDALESIEDEWLTVRSEHWYAEKGGWTLSSWTANPGELYKITVSSNCQLVWNNSGGGIPEFLRAGTDYFTYTETPDYMAINIDTLYSDAPVKEVAVFRGETCLGASKVYDNNYPVQILAYTPRETKGESSELEFRVYQEGEKEAESESLPYITYDSDTQVFSCQPLCYERNGFACVQLNTKEPTAPQQLTLLQNYPNPVKTSTTTIRFMPEQNAAHTELNIYNIRGQLVRTIDCDGIISSGTKDVYYSITWDCRDRHGKDVKNGIYFYKLTSGEKSAIHKMLLMK